MTTNDELDIIARTRSEVMGERVPTGENLFLAWGYPTAIILVLEFGRRFGLTLKQAFNYLSRFGAIKFVDEHYDYCHTQSFQSMVSDMAEYCHRKGGTLL